MPASVAPEYLDALAIQPRGPDFAMPWLASASMLVCEVADEEQPDENKESDDKDDDEDDDFDEIDTGGVEQIETPDFDEDDFDDDFDDDFEEEWEDDLDEDESESDLEDKDDG